MRVYLAGPILGVTDDQAIEWRESARIAWNGLPIETVSPMVRDYRGREDENVAEIVEGDIRDIESCDIVLAFCWQPSVGTSMEIRHAWTKGIPVYAIVYGRVSPWLRYHATLFQTLGDALVAIARKVA